MLKEYRKRSFDPRKYHIKPETIPYQEAVAGSCGDDVHRDDCRR
jgi:hypothetical protein